MFQGKRKSPDAVTVRTIELKDKILAVCNERGDSWASDVNACIYELNVLAIGRCILKPFLKCFLTWLRLDITIMQNLPGCIFNECQS